MNRNIFEDIQLKLSEIEFMVEHGKNPRQDSIDELGNEIAALNKLCTSNVVLKLKKSFSDIQRECRKLSA